MVMNKKLRRDLLLAGGILVGTAILMGIVSLFA